MHRCAQVALALLALLGSLSAQAAPNAPDGAAMPEHWLGPGPMHKVLLGAEEMRAADALRASGAVRLEVDYGAFRLFLVDGPAYGGRESLVASGLPVRDEYALIPVNGRLLDGTHPDALLATLPADERMPPGPDGRLDREAGLYLVQFVGPVRDAWVDALRTSGARIVQPIPMNAYVVGATRSAVDRLESLGAGAEFVQFLGAWEPGFRMTPTIRQWADDLGGVPVPVTVQLVDGTGLRDLVQAISVVGEVSLVHSVGPYVNVDVDLDAALLPALARQPLVFAIEQRGTRQRQDERQGQTVAGNIAGSGPSAPGYLAWLASMGFTSGQFGSFSVNVVDDATSLGGHPDLASSRVDFSQNPTSQGGSQGGHGFLNANIVAGFNNASGAAFQDGGGYHYGLGIAPWAHMGSTAIFGSTGASISSWESSAYNLGARISTNSWSFVDQFQNPIADYDTNAQEVDGLVRDARSAQAGNQEYMLVFAASNDGPGSNTVSTPGTAKNIVTVGASENDRQTGTDGCGIGNSGANNIHDIISFSSHGPVNSAGGDGRIKPEIVAPGTHVQAGVPQGNYNGSSVCDQYWPSGQTLYGWSSGTSHSTPAVAGGAALVRQWFLNNAMSAPSPAMNKAVLLNGARYLTGAFANDTLPSNAQGLGGMDLGNSFATVSRILVDQSVVLAGSGASHVETGSVADPGQPFRVTLVWTDAPGPTTGAPWVNDLDLTVTVGGQTYRGNVFSGAHSVTGGSADFRNNNESVFLPAGQSGPISVTVTGASIGGDGVPGNGDVTDQDFALVIFNGTTGGGPTGPVANFTGTPLSGVAPLAVSFADASTGTIDTWSWDFGDTTTSSAQNPAHTFNSAGSYTVSLTVTGPGGFDTQTKVGYVIVTTPPPPGVGDGSFELQTAGIAPAAPWSIVFGTGHLISPSGVSSDNGMPADGTQWCEVAADSTNNATPPSNPGGVTNPPVGGAGVQQSFTHAGGQTVLTFSAAFLRNESPNSTFNDWMSVDLSDGSTTVNVYYKDTFSPTSGTSAKYGFAMTPVEAISVDLGVLFPSSTPSTLFSLTALVGNGSDNLQDSKGYLDNVLLSGATPAPVAGFSGTPTSGTVPLAVAFTDLSTGSVTSWLWDFGDGNTSTAQHPNHGYTGAGSYTVGLTATGPGGSDVATKVGYITVTDPPPIADFTGAPTTGTAPLLVAFSDASSGPVSSWSWDFGDTTTSTAQNPSHVYASPGSYTVALTATGPGGSDVATKVNYVTVSAPPPVAGFSGTPTSGTLPLLVSFSDLSGGSVTSWSWDFGDTTTSTAQNPNHTYTAAGIYTVTLTATGPGGNDAATKLGYITVNEPPPVADFVGTPTSGAAPLNVSFSDLSSGGPVTSWSWDFGDSSTSTSQDPSHTYTAAGTYSVSLTATGPGGSDVATKVGYVTVSDPPPVADFSGSPTTGIDTLTVNFTDLSSGGPVTSWSWTFGDTATSAAQNPAHTYTAPGTYTVSLTVSGPGGSDIATKIDYVTVSPDPFVIYGTGSGGAFGVPGLDGTGDLTPGSATGFTLSLTAAAPAVPVLLFVGLAPSALSIKGQSLLVFPFLTEYSLGNTQPDGTLTLPGAMPVSTPPTSLYLQSWMQDPTGVQGLTSTNGLRLDVP